DGWLNVLLLLMFAYGGFEAALIPMGEAKDPRRDAPFALLVGLGAVAVAYVLVQVTVLATLTDPAANDRPLAASARMMMGESGAVLMTVAAMLSVYGWTSGGMLNIPRLTMAMADRGDLPKVLGRIHPRYHTPYVSIVGVAVAIFLLSLQGSLLQNISLATVSRMITYGLVCATVLTFRRWDLSRPGAVGEARFRAPAGQTLAILGIVVSLVLVVRMNLREVVSLGAVVTVAAIHWAVVRGHAGRAAAAIVLLIGMAAPALAQQRVSEPGRYEGWSAPQYDGWQRTAQYLTMDDGVRIAIDVIRPTRGGALHGDPLPVVWTHSRYHRASMVDGRLTTILDWSPSIRRLLQHGYIVAAADTRGGGASFGTQQAFFMPRESRDAFEITEWLASQPWSDGRIGMFGRSYLGITQYFAASEKPPHLKAIFPEMAVFDFYEFIYPGGIYRLDFMTKWQQLTSQLDRSARFDWGRRQLGPAAPMDGDSGSAWLAAAIAEHGGSGDIQGYFASVPFRNSFNATLGAQLHLERSPSSRLGEIQASGVAVYHLAGWFDMFPRDATLWFRNLTNPQKLIIGPWYHGQTNGFDLGAEQHRWFDYWLKGVDNGIMREPPVHYFVMTTGQEAAGGDDSPDGIWAASATWPPRATAARWFFGGGASGSVGSANDGVLARTAPVTAAADRYVIDFSTTTGTANRWTNGYGGGLGYPDMTTNEAKALTWTSAPLNADLTVVGHPIARVWVTANAPDTDVFVYLSEVDAAGRSHYVTEGALRASRRTSHAAPYQTFGLPWRRHFPEDVRPLAGEAVELAIDLHPTARVFPRGSRIRVTVAGADRDNTFSPMLVTEPTLTVHRSPARPSGIELPVAASPQP
ncbi:MAG: hydrolase CocE/NonD family protein, partial [Gemmatimonadetes bacterium]|nr:hydrolase CocE/NonD family protein [Gemmatimonadota bacterium]